MNKEYKTSESQRKAVYCPNSIECMATDDKPYYQNRIMLLEENQELKKQLEEINKMIEKCGFVNIEQVMLNYCGLLTQQKEFIKYLEDEIQKLKERDIYQPLQRMALVTLEHNLQKYKEIIGDDK